MHVCARMMFVSVHSPGRHEQTYRSNTFDFGFALDVYACMFVSRIDFNSGYYVFVYVLISFVSPCPFFVRFTSSL